MMDIRLRGYASGGQNEKPEYRLWEGRRPRRPGIEADAPPNFVPSVSGSFRMINPFLLHAFHEPLSAFTVLPDNTLYSLQFFPF